MSRTHVIFSDIILRFLISIPSASDPHQNWPAWQQKPPWKSQRHVQIHTKPSLPVGIDKVIISMAETPPITPALLFIATFVIIVNIVQIGTTSKVTQNCSWNRLLMRKKSKAYKPPMLFPKIREVPKWTLLSKSSRKLKTAVRAPICNPFQPKSPKIRRTRKTATPGFKGSHS